MTVCHTRASFTSKSITLSISQILMTLVFTRKILNVCGATSRGGIPRFGRSNTWCIGYLAEFIFKRKFPDHRDRIECDAFTRFSRLPQTSCRRLTPLFFTVGFVLVLWAAIVFFVIYQLFENSLTFCMGVVYFLLCPVL